jgi:hypothetical protein
MVHRAMFRTGISEHHVVAATGPSASRKARSAGHYDEKRNGVSDRRCGTELERRMEHQFHTMRPTPCPEAGVDNQNTGWQSRRQVNFVESSKKGRPGALFSPHTLNSGRSGNRTLFQAT